MILILVQNVHEWKETYLREFQRFNFFRNNILSVSHEKIFSKYNEHDS